MVIPAWCNSDRRELSTKSFRVAESLPIEKPAFEADREPTLGHTERIVAGEVKKERAPRSGDQY